EPRGPSRRIEGLEDAPDHLFSCVRVSELDDARAALARERFDAILIELEAGLDTLPAIVTESRAALIVAPASTQADAMLRRRLLDAGASDVLFGAESDGPALWRSIVFAIERERNRTQQQQIERLVALHPDPVLVLSAGGIVRFANRAALRLFDRTPAQFLEQPLRCPLREDAVTEIEIASADRTRFGEMRVVRFDWQNEPAFLASVHDVTERKQAEQTHARKLELEASNLQIREQNRLKTVFLAKMSHELRTPLNAIIGFAQLLFDREVPIDSPQHREFIGDILTSGHYLLRLINDVLDLAKVEAGRTEFRSEPVHLPSFIAEVCASLRTLAARKHVQIEIETDPDLAEVVLDPLRLRQILQNYLANAIRFSKAHGQIAVRATIEDADLFRLEVCDTGVGIDPSQLSEIFAEFRQLDVGRDREQRELGTGLGLALTKRLVEAQGGSVGVRSTRGQGSVFHAILPRRVATTSWPPLPASELEEIGGVLVVIADDALCRIIVSALSELGLRAIFRRSGPSGLEAMKKLDPLAVVMDIVM
ncbi:MAG TPA: ATP-binding protein, partial [Polyangiales bacterium]